MTHLPTCACACPPACVPAHLRARRCPPACAPAAVAFPHPPPPPPHCSGKREGATLACGGKRLGTKGYYIEPTVFTDVRDSMSIAREEIFGPVQTIMKWKTVEEVVARANDNEYGLASGVFGTNIDTINTLTRAIKAGTVWVNCYNLYDGAVPFGGYKKSGVGREKGEYALSNYTQVKAVYMPLANPAWR